MKDGFLKIATLTPVVTLCEPAKNADAVCAAVTQASTVGAKLLVLSALCMTGATCGDAVAQESMLTATEEAVRSVLARTAEQDIVTVLGAPVCARGEVYNAALVLHRGKLLGIVPKTYATQRPFRAAPQAGFSVSYAGYSVPFGKDILFRANGMEAWSLACEVGDDADAPIAPEARLCALGATVIVHLAASPTLVGSFGKEKTAVAARSAQLTCAYVRTNTGAGESTTDNVYGGGCVVAENGNVLATAEPFDGSLTVTELDLGAIVFARRNKPSFVRLDEPYAEVNFCPTLCKTELTRFFDRTPFVPTGATRREELETVLTLQAQALAARLSHVRAKKAVIGVSGGLDSTLALLVAVRAMELLGRPHTDVLGITMPCFGTTSRTLTNAMRMMRALGIETRRISIAASVRRHLREIGHAEDLHDVAFENAQARERTQVLMDVANTCGGIVVGTGDLSELALGWATFNGDHMSMYGVNAGVTKTLVRALTEYEAERLTQDKVLARTLRDVLDTPVSPELLPTKDGEMTQITEDKVGPYVLHDFFLYHMMLDGYAPTKLRRVAQHVFKDEFDGTVVDKWIRVFLHRFVSQQFKRNCLPDGVQVCAVTLSPRGGLRMPSDASAQALLCALDRAD